METNNNSVRLDDLLSRAQDPNRIKTAKEFMNDKKQEEMQETHAMAMGYVSSDMSEDENCVEICTDEECAPQDCAPVEELHSSQNSEQTTSSI